MTNPSTDVADSAPMATLFAATLGWLAGPGTAIRLPFAYVGRFWIRGDESAQLAPPFQVVQIFPAGVVFR